MLFLGIQLTKAMKRVTDIPFFKNIKEVREYQFGKFYFFDGLVISEMNKGVTFDWVMAQKVIKDAQILFGDSLPFAYISNRISDYQVVPTDWSKFVRNRHRLDIYCVVGKSKNNFASIVLERMFFGKSIRKFNDLDEAIAWILPKIEVRKHNKVTSVN